ncbi:MAG TPA: hypothetical protein PK941_06950 [Paludibacter sp.]|nr:hypothetical protein [Paludibacter sp.]
MIDIYSDEWKKLPLKQKLKAALEMPPLEPTRRTRKRIQLSSESARLAKEALRDAFKEIESKNE